MRHFSFAVLAFVFAVALFCSPALSRAEDITVVLGAFSDEVQMLKGSMTEAKDIEFSGLKFRMGKLNGRRMAVGFTGVGTVNAAMTTGVAIDRFHPKELIFTGVAGAVDTSLEPGDVVIGEQMIQYDLGILDSKGFTPEPERNPVDGIRNPLYFQSDARLVIMAQDAFQSAKLESPLSKAERKPKMLSGVIATGDLFVASEAKCAALRKDYSALAVEMEGAAVAQVCFQLKVPFVVIRSISDKADAGAKAEIAKFYKGAAANSAKLVELMAGQLEKDSAVVH